MRGPSTWTRAAIVLLMAGIFGACGDAATTGPAARDNCVPATDRAPVAGGCTLVDWDAVAVAGTNLTIEYLANDPGCSLDLDRVDVVERDEAVTLLVIVGYAGDDGGACPTALSTRATTVELTAPLGDRRLLGCRPEGSFAPAGGYNSPDPRDPEIDCSPDTSS